MVVEVKAQIKQVSPECRFEGSINSAIKWPNERSLRARGKILHNVNRNLRINSLAEGRIQCAANVVLSNCLENYITHGESRLNCDKTFDLRLIVKPIEQLYFNELCVLQIFLLEI